MSKPRLIKRLIVEGDDAQTFELHASHWLAEANHQRERGNTIKAEGLYNKAQHWLDRANEARGWN